MDSLPGINGLAHIVAFIGVPVLLGAAALVTLVLTGAAERIVMAIEDASMPWPLRRRGR